MKPFEQKVFDKYTKEGWKILRSGWPDFLLIKGSKIKAMEIKSEKDHLRPNQEECLKILSNIMPVFTVHEKYGYGNKKDKVQTLIYPFEATLDYHSYMKNLEKKRFNFNKKDYDGLGVS